MHVMMHLRGGRNLLLKLITGSTVYRQLFIFPLIYSKEKEGATSLRSSTALEVPGASADALYLCRFVSSI